MSVGLLRITAVFGLVLMLAACALSDLPAEKQPPLDQAPLLWPPEAAEARIAFVKTFSRPNDLGIGRGFFQRLADVLFGGSESRLVRPMAVVAVGGVLYVADPGIKGVHRFDPTKSDYEVLRLADQRPLPSPVALARGAEGEVYVTDSVLASVFVIRPGAKFAQPVRLLAPLGQPTGIACEPATGRLFVVDTTAHRVNVFNREGALESSFGGRGGGDGEFNYPTLLWLTADGRLYVTDSLNFRVQIFDTGGRFLSKFGQQGDGTGDAGRQKGVATDRYGHVYVVDALFNALQIFDDRGRFLLSVGELGSNRGEFWLPTGIFIGEDDFVYVADSYNRRVQVFRYVGGPT